MSKNESTSSNNLNPVITTIITVVGGIIVAYFAYRGIVEPKKLEISATQTAEVFRATQTAEGSHITPIAVVSTNIAESIPTIPTLIPISTAWVLENITYQHLCSITVSDFPEANRDNVKRMQFTITEKGGYCSWVIPLNGYNATSKKQVTFWVKGEKGGEQYEVGIKDIWTLSGFEPKVTETASASWTQVIIPLRDSFANQDLSSLENFSLNFEIGSGAVYVDQLVFTP